MIEVRFNANGLMVGFYEALADSGKNIILCQGLPGYVTPKHQFINDLTELGFNVFVPRYYGTWESDGDFSPQTSLKSVIDTIKLAKLKKANSLFDDKKVFWENKEIILLGFSFGALFAVSLSDFVDRTILVAPFLPLVKNSVNALNDELGFVKRGYPNVYRFYAELPKFIDDYVEMYKEFNCVNKKIKIIYGKNDSLMTDDYVSALGQISKDLIPVRSGHSIDIGLKEYEKILF
jgi:alpha-beta hydrolase superfamily lysophospholipase